MDWLPALIAALALPAVATAVGLGWRARTGRLRESADGRIDGETDAAALGLGPDAVGRSATLVQFSTAWCSRCPGTARQLVDVAAAFDGVRHVEIDLTHRADLADRFRVLQTPTTLILDADGRATARIAGVPRLAAVHDHLDRLTRRTHVAS